jgi:hypothetical protein
MQVSSLLLVFLLLGFLGNSQKNGLTDRVTWDKYSLLVDGTRVYVFAGEFHYQRLPVPELWLDIFQKFRAHGMNAVRFVKVLFVLFDISVEDIETTRSTHVASISSGHGIRTTRIIWISRPVRRTFNVCLTTPRRLVCMFFLAPVHTSMQRPVPAVWPIGSLLATMEYHDQAIRSFKMHGFHTSNGSVQY